jgi:transposase-like protein
MGKRSYTNEFKAQVVEYYKTHTVEETMQKFGIPKPNASKWALKAGVFKGQGGHNNHPLNFKHEVCQYYDNHTGVETVAKFGVTNDTLCRWRRELGYRNKSRGYNLYTQGYRQEARAPLHFKSVRGADGKYKLEVLQKRITDLETQIATMQPDVELAQSIRNLFN